MNDIKVVRLTTGELLVSQYSCPELDNDVVKLTNPSIAMMTKEGLGLFPWCAMLEKQEVHIKKEHIIYVGTPKDELVNAYKNEWGMIVTPTKSLIL